MRRFPLRRGFVIALMLACGAASGGCEREPAGDVRVAVIGGTPEIATAQGPLEPGDAVLLQNVAQGLVRFDPRGQIVPGLAERWNVSDDGLSYIFRLASGEWPDGRKITARQVARILKRQIARGSDNPLKDALGAIEDVVAMTDRVVEIRLRAPRPDLLQLLAQPEVALVFEGQGSGPFAIAAPRGSREDIRLQRQVPDPDEDQAGEEQLVLSGMQAVPAIRAFAAGNLALVLGGTFTDLPLVPRADVGRNALQFDPAAGLFGLVPARAEGPASDPEVRRLLSQAIDRDALISRLAVPGLTGRATLLEPGLAGVPDPAVPAWAAASLGDRRPDLIQRAEPLLAGEEPPTIRIDLPEGPGADLLLGQLAADWGLLGVRVERSGPGKPADFVLIDEVAPSTSPAWFVRQFRCELRPVCSEEADELLQAARAVPIVAQRGALLAEAARLMDESQLFIPLAAPIRWSLVSNRIEGFAGNRFARHTLTGLEQTLDREGAN